MAMLKPWFQVDEHVFMYIQSEEFTFHLLRKNEVEIREKRAFLMYSMMVFKCASPAISVERWLISQ